MSPIDRSATSSDGSVSPIHPRHAYIGADGYRDLSVEGEVQVLGDMIAIEDHGAVLRLELNPEGVEFLLDVLEQHDRDDGFTRRIAYARDLTKEVLWDRAAGRGS